MFKLLKRKGALFIEYALILAFVVVIGSFFIADNGIKNSIVSVFDKVNAVFDNTKSFKEKYPNNTASSFKDFALAFKKISDMSSGYEGADPKKLAEKEKKDQLKSVMDPMKNSTEILYSELSEEQKDILNNLGIDAKDLPYTYIYKDNDMVEYKEGEKENPGRWYVTWTDADMSKAVVGDTVNVMTYSFSGGNKGKNGFYVYTTTVGEYTNPESGKTSPSITNGQMKYEKLYESYGDKRYTDAEAAVNAFKELNPSK